jgi:hypothetical protein
MIFKSKFKEIMINVFIKCFILKAIKEKFIQNLVMLGNINLRWIRFNKKLLELSNLIKVF